jgi:pheromone shutdown protein TraB
MYKKFPQNIFNAILFLVVIFSLTSCSIFKSSKTKTKITTDSTAKSSSLVIKGAEVDSNTHTLKVDSAKASKSEDYDKETVIEFFTEGPDSLVNNPALYQAPRLKQRTTIREKGKVVTIAADYHSQEVEQAYRRRDSLRSTMDKVTTIHKDESYKDKKKSRTSYVAFGISCLLLIVALLIIWYVRRKMKQAAPPFSI